MEAENFNIRYDNSDSTENGKIFSVKVRCRRN